MEVSVIYDLLEGKIQDRREELEKEETFFKKDADEDLNKLEKSLNEEQLKILKSYKRNLMLHEEYVDYQVGIRTLNYGIKMGIQLQMSLHELYNYFDEPENYW